MAYTVTVTVQDGNGVVATKTVDIQEERHALHAYHDAVSIASHRQNGVTVLPRTRRA